MSVVHRHNQQAQRQRRLREQTVRCQVAAACRVVQEHGVPVARVTRILTLSERTARRWRQEFTQATAARGRPPRPASRAERNAVFRFLRERGPETPLSALRATFQAVRRAELQSLLVRYRRLQRQGPALSESAGMAAPRNRVGGRLQRAERTARRTVWVDPGGERPGQSLPTGLATGGKGDGRSRASDLYPIVRRAWTAAGDEERQWWAVPGRLDQAGVDGLRGDALVQSAAATELQRWHRTSQRAIGQLSGSLGRVPRAPRFADL